MPDSSDELEAEAYRIEAYSSDSFVYYTKFKVNYLDDEGAEQIGYDGGMIIHRNGDDLHGHIQLPESGNIFEIWSLGDGKHILTSWNSDAMSGYFCKTNSDYEGGSWQSINRRPVYADCKSVSVLYPSRS